MTRIKVAHSHLELQAEMSFGAELALYQHPSWSRSKSVVDFGCGNGAYLSRLALHFTSHQFTGIDVDQELLNSIEVPTTSNLRISVGSYDSLPSGEVDVLHMRFVMMYLNDPSDIMGWAKKHVTNAVFQIDPEDSKFVLEPDLPLFRQVFKDMENRVKRLGGTSRRTSSVLLDKWKSYGFSLGQSETIVITSEPPFSRKMMHLLMILNAEVVLGRPLPIELYEELLEWYFSDSYVQYGITRHLFLKE